LICRDWRGSPNLIFFENPARASANRTCVAANHRQLKAPATIFVPLLKQNLLRTVLLAGTTRDTTTIAKKPQETTILGRKMA